MAGLKINDLMTVVGTFVLNVPSLEVRPGEIVCVMGESGCGKSTLLNSLAGFLPLKRGKIFSGDRELSLLPPEKRRIALVFQRPSLFPHLNVLENVAFALRLQGASDAECLSRARTWLLRLQIRELESRRFDEVSDGQAQRVSLARALASEFPVLLLDEPFSALDVGTRVELRKVLREMVAELKISALMVTHHPEDALQLADRIVILETGKVAWSGKSSEIASHRELPAIARLFYPEISPSSGKSIPS